MTGVVTATRSPGDVRLDILYEPEPSTPVGPSPSVDENDEAEAE
jgi:hypothetical protein